MQPIPVPDASPEKLAGVLTLKPGKEKSLRRRHPWVFAAAVDRVTGEPGSGETVELRGADGRFLCRAAYAPASVIRTRAWSFDETETVDAAFLRRRIREAVARRAPLAAHTNAVRLVFGEADQLPGLVVDRYAGQLVVQFHSAGVERWREVLLEALIEATGCQAVYDRSDPATCAREGLTAQPGVLRGPTPGLIEVVEHGVRYEVDVERGHKTGFYIDQRDNRAEVAAWAAGRRVLNAFCYTGGFTLAARRAGAIEALSIDSSAEALRQAARLEQLNGLAASAWVEDDVFKHLRVLAAQSRRFDLIVLDPPKFAPTSHHVDRAARAYKDINLKALELLAPGGLLFTFSCSSAISTDLFQKIVAGAVFDARVEMQLVKRLQAGIDHPMLMTHPEGEYLKGLMLQRIS